jgi:hypothetical protein
LITNNQKQEEAFFTMKNNLAWNMIGFLNLLDFAGKTRQAATCPLDMEYEYGRDGVAE